jgi:hypothetical protein
VRRWRWRLSIEDVGELEAESRVRGMMVVGSCFVFFLVLFCCRRERRGGRVGGLIHFARFKRVLNFVGSHDGFSLP